MPVIIAVRSNLLHNKESSAMGHFIVITKYENGKFWYNDPKDGRSHKIKEDDLMFAWVNNVRDSSAHVLILYPSRQYTV